MATTSGSSSQGSHKKVTSPRQNKKTGKYEGMLRSDISFTKCLSYPIQFHTEVFYYGMTLLELYKATVMVRPMTCAGEAFFLISFILTAEKLILNSLYLLHKIYPII